MTELQDYIIKNSERGACKCGRCIDSIENPKSNQPKGHTADLVFFEVSSGNGADKEALKKLIKQNFPYWLDGKEHSYLEIGADLGDQGLALMAMGLGNVVGLWDLLTPKIVFPDILWKNDNSFIMQMAGQGYISIQVNNK